MFDARKITIKKNDKKIYTILARIYLIEIKLPVFEYNKVLDMDKQSADNTYQRLFDQ